MTGRGEDGEASGAAKLTTGHAVSAEPLYDVFLCHNSREKERLRELNHRLRHEFGLRTFFDESELVGGRVWTEHIKRALSSSKTCAVCLGQDGWGPYQLEGEAKPALERQKREPEFAVIPVLLPGMKPEHMMVLESFFQKTHWVDFREDWREPASIRKLAAAVRGVAAFPEGKPELSPLRIRFDAFRWDLGGRKDRTLFYRGSDLREAQVILLRYPDQLTEDAMQFVRASVAAEKARQWTLRGIAAAVMITITVLLILTEQRRRGEQQAKAQAIEALGRETSALASEKQALGKETIARAGEESARKAEVAARKAAEKQRDEAVRQRNLAYSRFLVSEGERLVRAGQDRKASVFFVEALQMADSPEARGSLLTQTLKNPHLMMAGVGVPGTISAVASTPRGQVAIADQAGKVAVVNFGVSQALSSTYGGQRQVTSFATKSGERLLALEYADDGQRVLGLGVTGILYEWPIEGGGSGPEVTTMLSDLSEVVALKQAFDGPPPVALIPSAVVLGSAGTGIRVFRVGAAPGHVTDMTRFSSDQCFGVDLAMDRKGEWLACYALQAGRRLIRIWDVKRKTLAREIDIPFAFHFPSSVAMSADGRYLALADSSDLLAIWDWRRREAPPVIPQPHEVPKLGSRGFRPIQQVTFSLDGNYLTTLYDGRAYLWHAASGLQLAVSANAEADAKVTYVSLGEDGKSWLIGRSRALGVVDLNPSVWQYWACIDAGGSISPEDWSRLLPGLPYRCTCARNFPCSAEAPAGRGRRNE